MGSPPGCNNKEEYPEPACPAWPVVLPETDTGGLEAKAATAAKGECKTWPELLEFAITGLGLDEDVLEPGLVSGLDTGLAVPSLSRSVASTTNC